MTVAQTSVIVRSVARIAGGGGGGPYPLTLFAGSEVGFWLDATDISTLWQVGNGTVPVVDTSDPVGRMEDKTGNALHSDQLTLSRRPIYNTSGWVTFDGADDWIEPGDSDQLTFGNGANDFPFSMSIRANVASGNGAFLTKYTTANQEYTLGYISSNVIVYLYDKAASAYIGRSAPGFVRGEWAEWSSTYDGGGTPAGVRIYKNGVRADTSDVVFGTYVAMNNLTSPLSIARNNSAFGGPSNMSFSAAVVINRVLSADEVLQLSKYNAALVS